MRSFSLSLNTLKAKFTAFALLFAAFAVSAVNINAQKIKPTKSSPSVPVTQEAARETVDSKSTPEIVTEQFQQPGDGSTDLVTAATYPFTTTNAVLDDMSTGTTQLVAASADDTASAVTNVGFDFWFDGIRYTQFSANANGLIKLGAIAVTTSFDNASATSGFATTTNSPKIAPYYDDLCTGTNGKVHYKITGTAPNRKLTVEFLNMQISRGAGCAGVGNGTFQAWLFESAATTNPGVIQFVYGALPVGATATDGGYSVGLQSGAATNFASVTTSTTPTVSYAAANNTNATAITAGTSYLFTPNIPLAPTNLTFTGTNAVATTLNFADNATNEFGYAIYRSTDGGVTYTFLAQTAANATTYTDSGLSPTTTYFYRVYAVTEGALSNPALTGNTTTAAVGNDTCAGAGGNYSDPTVWADGSAPTAGDNVTIQAGCAVVVNTNSAALSVTIANGGSLTGAAATTLTVGGDLTNNGTLDLSPTNAATGTGLVFTGANNNTFGGTGAINDVLTITVNKGTSNANVLELTATNFTVQGVATDVAGFLTLTNGTFKLSGTSTVTNRVFTAAGYTIGATTGFWLNNPNFVVAGQNGSPTVGGVFRVSQGTFNIGTATGNSMGFNAGANITVEGGAINAAGRFGVAAAANAIIYNQSSGTITVQTVGNASTTLAGFDLGTTTGSSITISGGTIVVQLAATGLIDYRNQAGSGIAGVTGGTLQLGNANSGAAKAFNIRGVVPNLVITNTSAAHTATFGAPVTYNNITLNITISTGTTLNLGNNVFLFAGPVLTNNGTLTSNGASSNFVTFNTTAPVSYTGTGTVTAPMSNLSLQSDLGFTVDPASPNIVATNIRVFTGNVTNANKLTLGNGGAAASAVQFGNTTTPTAAGVLDVPFTFNLGTGGETISYLRTTASRVTGGEINPARTLTALTYDDNDTTHTLTIAGGNLTVTGTTALTNGRVITGTNNVIIGSAGTVTRGTGYIDGNLNKVYAAVVSKTFEVGTANGYSPVTANVTAGTFPSSLTVKAVQQGLPGLDNTSSIARYWTLTEIGDLTADLSFTYLDADIVGNETTYTVFRREAGVTAAVAGSSNNAATNTASAPGINMFSDWSVGTALGPTAASVQVGGRVTTANGSGLRGALLTITDTHGISRNVTTSAFGYYRFDTVNAGETYLLKVAAKGYTFNQPAQALTVNDSLTGVNFTANR